MIQSLFDYCNDNQCLDLLMQWDVQKNLPLTPNTVTYGAKRKVWWICNEGHRWEQSPLARTVRGNGCPVCAGKIIVAGYNDLQTKYPKIADEWHPIKNGSLMPNQVSPNTHRKVWWRCKNGHDYQAMVSSRTRKTGCPVCAGVKIVKGINDLESQFPELAKHWHPTKNGVLKPYMVSTKSNRVVWWRDELGHEWNARIATYTSGEGCPICSNRKLLSGFNDLQTRYPEIAKEWDCEKNGITPSQVMPSRRIAWWRCPKGHEYQSRISARAYQKSGCPVCTGKQIIIGYNDFASAYPELAKQWHPTKNEKLNSYMVTAKSNRVVWWRDGLGHEWKAAVSDRVFKGSGCPYCVGKKVLAGFNDLASQEPEIATQWHPSLNGTKTPDMVTCGSTQKIWWQCADGHIWQAPIGRRTYQHSGCPVCAGKVSKKKLERYQRMAQKAEAELEIKRLNK